ncbi:hypothetical protein P8452_13265 [Trifolium repens]|nr:hypothetical protein P8452_13265 [Trifolium repens]
MKSGKDGRGWHGMAVRSTVRGLLKSFTLLLCISYHLHSLVVDIETFDTKGQRTELHKLLFRFCSHWRVSVIVVLVLTLLGCRSMDRVLLLTIARKQYLIKVGRDIRPVMRGAYTLFKDGGDPEKVNCIVLRKMITLTIEKIMIANTKLLINLQVFLCPKV